MALPTIPNTFVSGNTFIASDSNENFSAIENALSDGSDDINLANLTCVGSCNVSGAVSLSTLIGSGDMVVNSDLSCANDANFDSAMITPLFGFGSPGVITNAGPVLTSNSSYGRVFVTRSYQYIKATNLAVGTMLVIGVASGVSATFLNGLSSLFPNVGMRLNASDVTLNNVHDKLCLQLRTDPYSSSELVWVQHAYSKNG